MSHNLAWRVIDGENVGFQYAQRARQRSNTFDVEGVWLAVEYFQKQGINVVVVGRRPTIQQKLGNHAEVVLMDTLDDVLVLKEAHRRNCPIVSNDKYREWGNDLRIDRPLRNWWKHSKDIRVEYTFNGNIFVPALDLPTFVPSAHLDKLERQTPASHETSASACGLSLGPEAVDLFHSIPHNFCWVPADLPVPTLEKALSSIAKVATLYAWDTNNVKKALRHAQKVQKRYKHMTLDEISSITLYTMQSMPRHDSLYFAMYTALRAKDRNSIKPWRDYIWLLMNSLKKIPPRRSEMSIEVAKEHCKH